MTEEKTLTIHRPSALDVYGESEDIRRLAKRVQMCLPGGSRLNEAEALALAQLAAVYGLNPFNGEVWYIPGKGTMVGIKGLRKAARKQALYWAEHIPLTQQEREALQIPDKAIAYKCLIYRSDLIRQAAEAIQMMYSAGMKDAAERYAYRPTVGIGYWIQGEKTMMKPDQVARKRAEAEALKVAFDLPFASEPGNGDRVGYIDAEDWEVLPAGAQGVTIPTPQEQEHEAEGNGDQAELDATFPRFGDGQTVPESALAYYEAYWQDKAKTPANVDELRAWAKTHKAGK